MKTCLYAPEVMRKIRTGEKTQMRVVMKPQPVPGDILENGVQFWTYKDCEWLYGPWDKDGCGNMRNDLIAIGYHGFPESGIEDYAPCKLEDVLYAREKDPEYEKLGVHLRVKRVWVERLQDISHLDILAEGIKAPQETEWDVEMSEEVMNRFLFEEEWDKWAKAKDWKQYDWKSNPWVWVVEFERISKREAVA